MPKNAEVGFNMVAVELIHNFDLNLTLTKFLQVKDLPQQPITLSSKYLPP